MNSDLAPLADAIDTVLARWFNMRTDDLLGGFGPDRTVYRTDIVNAILAMPEMLAIKSALARLAPCALHSEMRGEPGSKLARNRMVMVLEGLDVPAPVIEWVLAP